MLQVHVRHLSVVNGRRSVFREAHDHALDVVGAQLVFRDHFKQRFQGRLNRRAHAIFFYTGLNDFEVLSQSANQFLRPWFR